MKRPIAELIAYCKSKNILFLSTRLITIVSTCLIGLGLLFLKSPAVKLRIFLIYVISGGLVKKVILSTGMADLGEIEDALDVLIASGTSKENIIVLHATTEYPCPIEDVNLQAMKTIAKAFGIKVGYSDHTNGIEVPIAASGDGNLCHRKTFYP